MRRVLWVLLSTLTTTVTAEDARAKAREEAKPALSVQQAEATQVAIELRDGSRIVGTLLVASLPFRTSYAKMDMALKLVESIEFAEDGQTAKVTCRNGDVLSVVVESKSLRVRTSFDEVKIALNNVLRLSTRGGGAVGTLPGGLSKELVLYYDFDQDKGKTVTDKSGQGNDGRMRNTARLCEGAIGKGLCLDGEDGYVSVPASASLDVGDGVGFTIAAWLKPTDVSVQHPLVEWNNGVYGAHFWISVRSPGSLYANLVDRQSSSHHISSGANVLAARLFSHVALTYDRATGGARLYLNGKTVAEENLGEFTAQTSYDVLIGRRPEGGPNMCFGGTIDEVQIFDRSLSSSEVQSISSRGRARD